MTGELTQNNNRRSSMALLLIFAVVLVYFEIFITPSTQPVPSEPGSQTQSAQPATEPGFPAAAPGAPVTETTTSQERVSDSSTGDSPTEPLTVSINDIDAAGSWKVRSSKYKVRISRLGGALRSFMLRQHKQALNSKEPLDLVRVGFTSDLPMHVILGNQSDKAVQYKLAGSSEDDSKKERVFNLDTGEEMSLRLVGQLASGQQIEKTYLFREDSYLFDVRVKLSEPLANGAPLSLLWNTELKDIEAQSTVDPFEISFLDSENSIERTQAIDESLDESKSFPARWIGFGEKYFLSALVSPSNTPVETNLLRTSNALQLQNQGVLEEKELWYSYRFAARGGQTDLYTKVYVGPKEYSDLKELELELHRSVNFGIFSFLAHPLVAMLHVFYEGAIGLPGLGNYGLAIILLTLVIKAVFLPLTQVSMKSMKAMQDLQPEIQALRERISDPSQLNQEMMALYKKRGVNPMGGCLPMLIQIPVFLGLYMALLNSIELRHAPFALWIHDLSSPEALKIFGIGVPVMVLLMGISMFFQQLTTPTAMDPKQKKIMMMMPVVFTIMFIVFPLPAGLVLYWLINNLISIVQQAYLRGEGKLGPMKATALASVAIFGGGYVLTLL